MTDPLNNPIFVIGAPRSGTSILGRILSSHPSLCYSNEPRFVWRYGNDEKSDALLPCHLNTGIRDHIRDHFSTVVEQGDGTRLLEKHPSNSLRMAFINEIFPDAVFVHVIRDGYESIASIKRYWENRAEGLNHRREGTNESILSQRFCEMAWRQFPYYLGEFVQRVAPQSLSGRRLWGPRLPGMKSLVHELPLLTVCALQWRACVEMATQYGRNSVDSSRYIELGLDQLSERVVTDLLGRLKLSDAEATVLGYFDSEFDAAPRPSAEQLFSPEELALVEPHVTAVSRLIGEGVQ